MKCGDYPDQIINTLPGLRYTQIALSVIQITQWLLLHDMVTKAGNIKARYSFFGGTGDDPENYLNSCGVWIYDESLLDVEGNEKMLYTTNQLLKYDPLSEGWTDVETTGSVPSPRLEFDLVELQGKVYMYGGRIGTATLADFYILDMAILSWTRLGCSIESWRPSSAYPQCIIYY